MVQIAVAHDASGPLARPHQLAATRTTDTAFPWIECPVLRQVAGEVGIRERHPADADDGDAAFANGCRSYIRKEVPEPAVAGAHERQVR